MKKIIMVLVIVSLTFALKPRTEEHVKRAHFLDGELCLKRGGKICGMIDKECCVKGCQSNFLGLDLGIN